MPTLIFIGAKTAANLAIISHRTMQSDVNYHEKGVLKNKLSLFNIIYGGVTLFNKILCIFAA